MSDPVEVLVGVGANLGAPDAQIEAAVAALDGTPGIQIVARSSLHSSAPVGGPPDQPDYRNGVVALRTTLPASALLALFKELERVAGRDLSATRNGPRPLDLDLLTYGTQQIDSRDLVVPHPRMLERDFVRIPLRELGFDPAGLPPPIERPAVVREPEGLRRRCRDWVRSGCRIGLVPTMGALHDGHASLIDRARAECDRVVVTVFVNPLQFGPGEDLDRYPRPFEADLVRCRAAGADLVFAPSVEAMYPEGFSSRVAVGVEADGLESAERPGHFEGVATVVARLWSLCGPDRAYFGQKDAQQIAVLRRLAADLGLSGRLVECGIVREGDGLARSSRNVYLAAADRAAAAVLCRALAAADRSWADGERRPAALCRSAAAVLDQEPRGRLDYLECRAAHDLATLRADQPVDGPVRLLLAVRFGPGRGTRLLDNAVLGRGELTDFGGADRSDR